MSRMIKLVVILTSMIYTSLGYAQKCQRVAIIDTENSSSTFLSGDNLRNKAQGKAIFYAFKDGWKISDKIPPVATSTGKVMVMMEKEASGDCSIIDPFM
ncbi:hypothetical protein [Cedecea sp.]|jgi:hypothetical protein|uniref:hypothetical protein n=1 Tax=Cedecea sp. TaxID=1970739 RepID=UPI0012ADBDF4|nr:hypothetical protein [Enterobacteriaceae bacterium RIT693]